MSGVGFYASDMKDLGWVNELLEKMDADPKWVGKLLDMDESIDRLKQRIEEEDARKGCYLPV